VFFISILEHKLDEIPSPSITNSSVNETAKILSNLSNPIITDAGSISSSTVHNSTGSPEILQNSPWDRQLDTSLYPYGMSKNKLLPLKEVPNDQDSKTKDQSVKPSSITDKKTNNDCLKQEKPSLTSNLPTSTNISPTMNASEQNQLPDFDSSSLSTSHKNGSSTNLSIQITKNIPSQHK
jgi:hypothetical protein